jgi:hypothetical protein
MTTRQGPGGKIPPQGRPAQAPGVGKNSKRHDLERPKANLQDTDLQYGEVSAAQRMAPKKEQAPARPGAQVSGSQGLQSSQQQQGMQVPPAREFMQSRLAGTLQGSPRPALEGNAVSPQPWLPLIQAMATAPNAGGVLGAAFVESLSQAIRRPQGRVRAIDMNELDRKVQELG